MAGVKVLVGPLRRELNPSLIFLRLAGQDTAPSHPLTGCYTRQCRTRETSSNVEPGIQSRRYETIRADGAQENYTIVRGNRAAKPCRPRRTVQLFRVRLILYRSLEPFVDASSIRFDVMADMA